LSAVTTVFLVDDDPLVTDSLGTALRLETPYHVRAFGSGPAALEALGSDPPDVLITDFKMPGMDGLELLRRVRARLPDAVLMLLTGYADKDSAILAVNEVGIFQYVEKPWDLHDLLLKLKAALERKELISKLREAQEKLLASERLAAVGRVVSGIAHELGNQLALVGYAEAIKARSAQNPEIAELADIIAAAHKRLAAMVAEIRDFARQAGADDSSPKVRLEPGDVVSIIEEALGILRYDRELVGRKIERDIRARPLARVDRGKLSQVVINLVRNAAQATTAGQPVRVTLDERDGQVVIEVIDEGAGMTPEVQARLGEPFFTTRGERGTGLGVGITRRIVAEHGGSMAFDSAPGRGTTVTVRLPALGGA
jgi:signal transduction histidine kinase